MKPYSVHKHDWLTVNLRHRAIYFCLCGEESLDGKNSIPSKYGTLTATMKQTDRRLYKEDCGKPVMLESDKIGHLAI
jgi:hypothetical protein